MGRELKRVPIDFDWPINETWKGYINPHYTARPCEACDGTGLSPQAKYLSDQWYGCVPFDPQSTGSIPFTVETPEVRALAERNCGNAPDFYGDGESAVVREASRLCRDCFNNHWSHHLDTQDVAALVAADRLHDFTHTWTGKKWEPKDPMPIPSAEEVNRWSLVGFGHDSINQWTCVRAKCTRLGYPYTCAACGGGGCLWPSEDDRQRFEAWAEEEPPAGDGFQLWQNTGDGSPVSPVFATLDELCQWCEAGATTFGSNRATAAEWKKMLDAGFVCHQEGGMVFI